MLLFFFQAEDGIRDLVRSRGLGDVYKRQLHKIRIMPAILQRLFHVWQFAGRNPEYPDQEGDSCLLYTSDAADERSSVDLGGRRIIKKKNKIIYVREDMKKYTQQSK